MVCIELHVELNYAIDEHGADFVFNIHAARTPCQTVSAESLVLSQPVVPDPSGTAIPTGFVRLGTGRDAADVSVATFSAASSRSRR